MDGLADRQPGLGQAELGVVEVGDRAAPDRIGLGRDVIGLPGGPLRVPGRRETPDVRLHGGQVLPDRDPQLPLRVHALQGQFRGLHLRLPDLVGPLPPGKDRDVQAEADVGIGRPFVVLEHEVVRHRAVVVGEAQGEGRQSRILLHPDRRGQLFRLQGQLPEGGVPVQRGRIPEGKVASHFFRIVGQGARHIHRHVQVDPHDRFQLPEGQDDRAFGIEHVRNGVGGRGLGPGQFQFRCLLHIETLPGPREIFPRIVIDAPVHRQSLFRKQDRIEGLFHLGDHVQPGGACPLDGKFHLLSGNLQALPKLGVDQRHVGGNACAPGVPSADRKALVGRSGGRSDGHGVQPLQRGQFLDPLEIRRDGAEEASPAAFVAVVLVHVHDLLLDGPLERTGRIDLGEQGGVGAALGVAGALDFLVGHLHGHVFAEGDPKRLVQRQDRGVRIGRCGSRFLPVPGGCRHAHQCGSHREHESFCHIHTLHLHLLNSFHPASVSRVWMNMSL